jgi:reticulon-4-interacting protein 1, mitochondrial
MLAEKYSGNKFDIVIDAFGAQPLFDNCSTFLAETGPYVTVGVAFDQYTYGSMLVAVSRMLKSILWPRFLGGTPRRYIQVASVCTEKGLSKLKRLCEDGSLRVPIDSLWSFDEVFKVRVQRRAVTLDQF